MPIPVVDSGSGSTDAEPLAEVTAFRQRRCGGMSSARQPDQPGWRARPIRVQKRYVRRIRDLHLEFFEHRSNRLEELRSVQPQSSSAGDKDEDDDDDDEDGEGDDDDDEHTTETDN